MTDEKKAELKWKSVTKEEFIKFLDNYPRKLTGDFFMDEYAFYDFTICDEPCEESKVAKDYMGEYEIKC